MGYQTRITISAETGSVTHTVALLGKGRNLAWMGQCVYLEGTAVDEVRKSMAV